MACLQHIPPFRERLVPDSARPGWFKVYCKDCGRFIGYRGADK